MTANKQATLTKRGPAPRALGPLIAEVRSLIQAARHAAASTVNTLQVRTNFEIGRRIVEHEQKGTKRAEYGAQLLNDLATRLTEEFGKGFSARNLRSFRSFFQTYRERIPKIWQKPSAKLPRIEGSPRVSSSYFVPPWNTVFAPGVKPAPMPSPGHQWSRGASWK